MSKVFVLTFLIRLTDFFDNKHVLKILNLFSITTFFDNVCFRTPSLLMFFVNTTWCFHEITFLLLKKTYPVVGKCCANLRHLSFSFVLVMTLKLFFQKVWLTWTIQLLHVFAPVLDLMPGRLWLLFLCSSNKMKMYEISARLINRWSLALR